MDRDARPGRATAHRPATRTVDPAKSAISALLGQANLPLAWGCSLGLWAMSSRGPGWLAGAGHSERMAHPPIVLAVAVVALYIYHRRQPAACHRDAPGQAHREAGLIRC